MRTSWLSWLRNRWIAWAPQKTTRAPTAPTPQPRGLDRLSTSEFDKEYHRANEGAVAQVMRGMGPDDTDPKAGAGARIVFNIAAAHVLSFCERSAKGEPKPYQNAYDLHRQVYFVNAADATLPLSRRQLVDKALEHATGQKGPDIYFGAIETSGTGVRFYGDMCLVLSAMPVLSSDSTKPTAVPSDGDCYLLDRNSYDVLREPVKSAITDEISRSGGTFDVAAGECLKQWLGTLAQDLVRVATEKVSIAMPSSARLWTGGAIAEVVLQDEDYFEVLRPRSFGTSDLVEVRVSAADAAAEADIATRERAGEAAGLHELEWRQQRREARRALARANVPTRVITTPGRLKAG